MFIGPNRLRSILLQDAMHGMIVRQLGLPLQVWRKWHEALTLASRWSAGRFIAWMAFLSTVFSFKELREWSCVDWRGSGKIEAIRPERQGKGRRMGRGAGASRA